MTSKQLRFVLLAGAALGLVGPAAQADELSALKDQLEALQSRINTLESTPATPPLPEGYSFITTSRGHGSNADWGNQSKADSINQANSRGFTVAISPTADLPAPIAEVTVYGFVKGDVIYSFDDNNASAATAWSNVGGNSSNDDHITIHAKQSRFGIKSKVDTAIGQIRTLIEGDFEGSPFGATDDFRLRHAYGEWDMTDNLTLIVGQTSRIAALLPLGITTVNFLGPAGRDLYPRDPQVKLRYSNGPLTVRVGIEQPISVTASNVPVFGGSIQYDIPGGHTLMMSAAAGENDFGGGDEELTYVLQAGFNTNLADFAKLTASVVWGEGPIVRRYTLAPYTFAAGGSVFEAIGLMAGVSAPITDTTTLNFVWDYLDALDGQARAGIQDELHTIHANVIWQPVKQMRMGWEVLYQFAGDTSQGPSQNDDIVQIQWGTWFFF